MGPALAAIRLKQSDADQRHHFFGELLQLRVAISGMTDEIHPDVANADVDEVAQPGGDVRGFSNRCIFLRRCAKVHRIALAQKISRYLEGGLVRSSHGHEGVNRSTEPLYPAI